MSYSEVEAVFYWRYNKSPFAAVYGRIRNSNEYSKDFLQAPAAQYPLMDSVLKRGELEEVPLRHVWPNGSVQGIWRKSAADNRGQLAWLPMNSSPLPWRVGDPATDDVVVIPGTPGLRTEAEANDQFARLQAQGLKPWIMSIKLRGEDSVLHSRAYLDVEPGHGRPGRTVSSLPEQIQAALHALPDNEIAGSLDLRVTSIPAPRAPLLVDEIRFALNRDPNVLLIGPPGSGKTVALEDLRVAFESEAKRIFFDPTRFGGEWLVEDRRSLSLVFHPSYGYEDFVGGLLPAIDSHGGFHLSARAGPLLAVAHWANAAPNRRALLIIDEFNRGATAAIFGDTLALLDNDKRLDSDGNGVKIVRPYSFEQMTVDASFVNSNGSELVAREVGLPRSVLIVAALNSSDRSITPLDAALRRRFAIISVPPSYDSLANRFGVTNWDSKEPFPRKDVEWNEWTKDDASRLLIAMLIALNERIGMVLGSDFLLGQALLWPAIGDSREDVLRNGAHAFDERIAAALQLTFVDQDDALAAVLQLKDRDGHVQSDKPRVARWIFPTDEMLAVSSPRVSLMRQSGRPIEEVAIAFRALL